MRSTHSHEFGIYSAFLFDCRVSILPLSIFIEFRSDQAIFGAGRQNRAFWMYGFPTVKIEMWFFSRFYCRECIAKSNATIQKETAVYTYIFIQRFAFWLSRSIFATWYFFRLLSSFNRSPGDFGAGRKYRAFWMYYFPTVKIEAWLFLVFTVENV